MTQILAPSLAREFDRLPPHSIDSEVCVLASMMLDKEVAQRIMGVVYREDFFQSDHEVIFAVLVEMHRAGRPVDAILLREELAKRQFLAEVGGNAYLGAILNAVPSAAHGEHYALIVREHAIVRRMIQAANDVIRFGYAPRGSDNTATAAARRAADTFAMLASSGTTDHFRLIGEVAADVLDAKYRNEQRRVLTGLRDLDEATGGLPLGGFTLVGSRPGVGKSQLCKQIATNIAQRGEPVGLVTIEETAAKVAENVLANHSGVANSRIVYNRLDAAAWVELRRATPDVAALNFWIDDAPVRLSEVEAAVTTAATKHGCRVVVVDYLQLIDPECSAVATENREITKVSNALKAAAKRLDIALVAACQLNRGNEQAGRKPTLRDLRSSGSLEQDGDLIILLHREDYYRYQEAGYTSTYCLEAIVAKNKAGPHALVPLHFSGKFQRVGNWNQPAEETAPDPL